MNLRFFSLTLLLGVLFAAGLAFAQSTPANTPITNVASATYNDSAGDPQTTFSNPVTTIVQQVYSFTITPNSDSATEASVTTFGQTETALPGAPIYFNYTVTNTGNGDDTIDLSSVQGTADNYDLGSVAIYLDTGCDGSVAGDSTVSSVTLGADDSACIIVAGTIPNTATDGQTGNLNLEGTSQGDAGVTDTNNWAQSAANTAGNLTGNKVASPASGTPVAAGGTISYTIAGSNNGGSAAYGVAVSYDSAAGGVVNTTGIVISDSLDSDVSYAAGTLSGTAGAGSVVEVYSSDGGSTWYEDAGEVPGAINAVGMIIVDPAPTSAFFPQSANYSVSFDVTVSASATVPTNINNSATIAYDTDSNGGNGTSLTTTNTTNNPVAASYDVKIGPEGLPANDLSATPNGSYTDPASGKTWTVDYAGDGSGANTTDTQTITDTVFTGDTVAFKHTIQNTGNASDSLDITTSSTAGYSVTLFQADGVSPLLGSVGPLAPGGTLDIVVKVSVSGTTGDTVVVTATSANDGSSSDISTDVIPTPESRSVDFATNSDGVSGNQSGDSDPSDDDPANQTAESGDALTYPIELTNTGNQDDTYDFSEALPTGWTVIYYEDDNCDGDPADAGESTANEVVTDTGVIAAGTTACFVAVVSVDANASNDSDPGTAGFQPYDIDFTVTSQADNTVTDTISTEITVQAADIEFISNQTATTSPDSVVTYSHTLINNGNLAASVGIPAQTGTAFIYQYSLDNTTFTSDLSAINVAAGGTQTVYVRVIVPDTANDGDSETVTVNAQVGGATVDSVQDTTIVQAGELDLTKSAQTCITADCSDGSDPQSATGASAEPGDYLEYTVVASNIGSGDLTNVKVSDPLPAFTNFVSISATTTSGGDVLYSTDGSTWVSNPALLTVTTGDTVYAAVDTNSSGPGLNAITTDDVLAAGETITLTFVVRVQ